MSDTVAQPSDRSQQVPPSRYLLFAAIAGGGCFLDLYSKRRAFESLGMPGESPVHWIWEGFFGIETSLNTGALFGLGHNRVGILAVLSIIALIGVCVWFVAGRVGRSRSLTIVLALITAGILGNLYDRLGLWSLNESGEVQIRAVRDWIRWSYGKYVWPNFNLADSYLVCSAIWLVGYSFLTPEEDRQSGDKAPSQLTKPK